MKEIKMIEEKELTMIHYGTDKYNPYLFEPITNRSKLNKPDGGLWGSSPDTDSGWFEWCVSRGYMHQDDKQRFEVNIHGRVITINSVADIVRDFIWKEVDPDKNYIGLPLMIDFEAMTKTVDAIHLTKRGQAVTLCSRPHSFFGWDCESILVLNQEVIKV